MLVYPIAFLAHLICSSKDGFEVDDPIIKHNAPIDLGGDEAPPSLPTITPKSDGFGEQIDASKAKLRSTSTGSLSECLMLAYHAT